MRKNIHFNAGNGRRKQAGDFNISKIIRQFYAIEDVQEQRNFLERKLGELSLFHSFRKQLGLLFRMRMAYLIRFRQLGLILNGLVKLADDDLEILSSVTDIETN